MKSRRKKVWTSEAQILKAIDNARLQLDDLSNQAALLEAWLRRQQLKGEGSTEEWNWKKARSLRLGRSIERLQKKRLNKLKHTLAAFRTLPMPFIDQKVTTQ